AKLGGGVEQPRGPLALVPAPDVDAVRHAIERLRDPETRLVDEFFWFWPETSATETPDEALTALDRGDVAAARKRWQAATTGAGVAVDQLAVQWAERRLPPEAERHKELMKCSGYDAMDADEALRRALRPVRERIKMLCETAAESGGHDNWCSAIDLFKGVAALPGRGVDR